MEFDSHSRNSSSSSVGTRPFGFIARYAGSRFLPNGPPMSMRSCLSPISPIAHITFCTFDDVVRPQIFMTFLRAAFFRHARHAGHPRLIQTKDVDGRDKPGHGVWM